MTRTLGALATQHGVDLLDHLDQQVTIPVLTGLQFQGDVAVIPNGTEANTRFATAVTVPAAGIPVVRGENGGNTHLLVSDGPVTWAPATSTSATSLTLGILTVPTGSTAFLIHPEHGANGIGAGTYGVRRQREQRDVVALIAD